MTGWYGSFDRVNPLGEEAGMDVLTAKSVRVEGTESSPVSPAIVCTWLWDAESAAKSLQTWDD